MEITVTTETKTNDNRLVKLTRKREEISKCKRRSPRRKARALAKIRRQESKIRGSK